MAACFELVGGVLTETATAAANCPGYVLLDQIDYGNWITGLTTWAYDNELLLIGFGGTVLAWVTGFGVGLVISIVRKTRM